MRYAPALTALASIFALAGPSQAQDATSEPSLAIVAKAAEKQLRQTFTNLQFEDFGPSPVAGPIYQASAGGRLIYYAPQSEHILFATIYDRNGLNLTALDQENRARKQLSAIDPAQALAIGPKTAPIIIEFTDPDCPYCRREAGAPPHLLRVGHSPGRRIKGRAYPLLA